MGKLSLSSYVWKCVLGMEIAYVLCLIGAFFVTGTAYAQMDMMGNGQNTSGSTGLAASQLQTTNANISAALQDIYKVQNVSDQTKIDCSKVTDDQFEKLGDAYMGTGISEQQHEAMEQMMGGEGSTTLKQAHITMSRAYLGCWANYNGAPSMMSMMGNPGFNQGFSMMGNGFGSGSGMMSGWPSKASRYPDLFMWFGFVTLLLLWASLVLSIMALLKWLGKNK